VIKSYTSIKNDIVVIRRKKSNDKHNHKYGQTMIHKALHRKLKN